MYWFHALLVTVFAFLASTDSLSAAAHSGQRKTGLTKSSTTAIVSNAKRSLRFNDKENGVVGGEDIIEGRGGGKLSDYFGRFGGMKSKMLQWARAGKSDDFVIENLDLKVYRDIRSRVTRTTSIISSFKRLSWISRSRK
ncbi:secreted RxLR effector peptide protein, putative [Phytophthora infestans T30-4]